MTSNIQKLEMLYDRNPNKQINKQANKQKLYINKQKQTKKQNNNNNNNKQKANKAIGT